VAIDWTRECAIRWPGLEAGHCERIREGGFDRVVTDAAAPELLEQARRAGLTVSLEAELAPVRLAGLASAGPGGAILEEGLWPGIRRPPAQEGRGDFTATASAEPWVDANGYLIGYLRALYPDRPAVLAYRPDSRAGVSEGRAIPAHTHETALAEAWMDGGNLLLALEAGYRRGLLAGEASALGAWRDLARTARWLKAHGEVFRGAALPTVTALVEPGRATAEIANLLYRRGAAPRLAPADRPPDPAPSRCLVLVAVSLRPPESATRARILAHARAGATVITDAPAKDGWWRVDGLAELEKQDDRVFYRLGEGRLVAYHRRIADPSEFALDVIDIVTHRRRALRMWNAPAVIGRALEGPRSGPFACDAVVTAVNYGDDRDRETLTRVLGHYEKALLLRPEAEPAELETRRRGVTTEVTLPGFQRAAAVLFRS
jgi:hypothetical protein